MFCIAVRSKVPTGKGLKPLVPQHMEVRSHLRGAVPQHCRPSHDM